MALTPRQKRFVDESLNQKISALRKIAMHLGMVSARASARINSAEQRERFLLYGFGPAEAALEVLSGDQYSLQSKAACGIILEFFVPDWMEIFGPELYGALLERDDIRVSKWRESVLRRDNYRCRECDSPENLHAHHIVRWAECPELRIEVSNGLTLCRTCHEAEHAKT